MGVGACEAINLHPGIGGGCNHPPLLPYASRVAPSSPPAYAGGEDP